MEKKKPFTSAPNPNNNNNNGGANNRNNVRRPVGKDANNKEQHRINDRIRAREVRLVGDNVEQGVYSLQQALAIADEQGLDPVSYTHLTLPTTERV